MNAYTAKIVAGTGSATENTQNATILTLRIGSTIREIDPVDTRSNVLGTRWIEILSQYRAEIEKAYLSQPAPVFSPEVAAPTIKAIGFGNFSFASAETRMQVLVDQAAALTAMA